MVFQPRRQLERQTRSSSQVVNFEGRAGLSVTTRVQVQGSPIKAAWETTASPSVSGSVSFSVTIVSATLSITGKLVQGDATMGVDLRRKSTATPTTYTAVTASSFFSGSLGLLALCPYATFALQPPSIKAELKYVVASRCCVVVRVRAHACVRVCVGVSLCVCACVRFVRRCDLVIDSRVIAVGHEDTVSATAGGDALSESGSQWLRETVHALNTNTCRVLVVPYVRQPRTTACACRTRCCRRPLRLRYRRPTPCQRRRRHRRSLHRPRHRPRQRHPRRATTARAAPSTRVPARAPPTSCTPTPPPPRVRVHACMPATRLCFESVCAYL